MSKTSNAGIAVKEKKSMAVKITAAVIIAALVIGIFFAANYLYQLSEYKKKIAAITVANVDLRKIPDGSYTGSYNAIMIAAKVRVNILDHKISNIDIIYHKNERGKRAEAVLNEIKTAQSLKVDTITGATNSSKVILKAVQNALNSGIAAKR